MDTTLLLKIYVDGENDTPFPQGAEEPIEIGAFRYDAKRMGGAPTITASVNYPSCLDNEWTDKVYAEFNGEKYYLKQTPTSSYSNESTMYKHDIELVSERVILDNVYFYDAVVSSEMETEPIIGNPPQSPEWQLFGNIDIDKEYTTFFARLKDGTPLGRFDVVFDEAIRIVSGPPMDMKIESATGDIYVHDNYGYFAQLGLRLVFSYISYEKDKPVSNGTNVTFFGNIREFAKRLQASLIKCGVDYSVIVDEDVESTEEKLMSFEDQFFSNVLQEIYNTYKVPYYFEGKTIHIGWANENVVIPTLSYGVDGALLSITKNNANYKIVNRVTGTGSSDNIPFYYPNNSPKGNIAVVTTSESANFTIRDLEKFANEVNIDDVVRYGSASISEVSTSVSDDGIKYSSYDGGSIPISIKNMKPTNKWFLYTFNVAQEGRVAIGGNMLIDGTESRKLTGFASFAEINNQHGKKTATIEDGYIDCGRLDAGSHTLKIGFAFPYLGRINYTASVSFLGSGINAWYNETQGKETSLEKMGIEYSGELSNGDTIKQTLESYVKTSQNLMPYKYRATFGNERFYNAINGPYRDEDGTVIIFNNPYEEGHPKEHIITVEDIKPTIKETEVNGLRIDMFSEFAYDDDDNDETYEDEEGNVYFKHPYFYGKLRVMDFNLFDHAIENQPMTISFTSGDCGACNFEIGVTEEYPQKNPVQVDEDGNLVRDDNGMVLAGIEGTQQDVTEFQDRQQDTSKYEVWIALKKEEETYGILMPQELHKPKGCAKNEDGTYNNDGDTFVILGINLPESYIINAEKKLEAEIIKYLKENNDEKFTFSIAFSRIYFAENDILDQLSENSKIAITYDGMDYDLYVSAFSYNMAEGEVLPEIRVELDDTLKVSQNALQNAIGEVKSSLGSTINEVAQAVAMQKRSYVSKIEDDNAQGVVNFTKGIKFGEGGKVEVMDNNSAKLTIEYLEVTKKASFTSLEIQEKTHVGGQMLITPAAINCGEVEEFDDYYRCYFQTKGESGDEIFNQFMVGDQAICQTYNAWGSRYYWRLVVGVGEDYIDLSKEDCDEYSDTPIAGDKIIQLGNRSDKARQSAIVLSAYGETSPSLIMYNGIDSFSLEGKNITGIVWNTETQEPQMYSYGSFFFGDGTTDEDGNLIGENFITYQKRNGEDNKSLAINADITIGPNSSGLSNLSEWGAKQEQINAATQGIGDLQYLKETFQKSVDVDGVVMSEMAAVKNDTNVVAFINGSENISDPQHGTLMFAAGVQDIDDPSTATTRIYEDGHVDTNDIAATGGTFENVVVKGSTRSPFSDGAQFTVQDKDNYVNISTSEVFTQLSNSISESGRRLTFVGRFAIMCQNGYIYDHGTTYDNEYIHIGNIWDETNPLQYEVLTLVAVKTSSTTVAWVVENREPWGETSFSKVTSSGMFAGLRPHVRTISSGSAANDKTITEFDHTIMIDSPSAITLTLPSDPQVGQEYLFMMSLLESTQVKHKLIASSSCSIHDPLANTWSNTSLNVGGYGCVRLSCALDSNGTKKWWIYRLR